MSARLGRISMNGQRPTSLTVPKQFADIRQGSSLVLMTGSWEQNRRQQEFDDLIQGMECASLVVQRNLVSVVNLETEVEEEFLRGALVIVRPRHVAVHGLGLVTGPTFQTDPGEPGLRDVDSVTWQ